MIVRSAVKFVSNTPWKPSRRRAAVILAGDARARRVAKALPQGRTNGRRSLHNDVLLRIIERFPDGCDMVLFG